MDNKKIAQFEVENSQRIIDRIKSKDIKSLTAEEFWKLRTAYANKKAFEDYLKGGLRELPHSLYNLNYKQAFIRDAFTPFELDSLLNKLKDPKTGKIANEGDIREAINSLIRTRGPLDELSKAMTTENLLDQLLGHIADKEMSPILGNDFDNTAENLRKIREHQIPGIGDVKELIGLRNDITFELPPTVASGTYNHPSGYINLNPSFSPDQPDIAFKKAMRRMGLGTFFHEGSHDIDEINQRIAVLRKELEKKNNPISFSAYDEHPRKFAEQIRQIVNNPDKKKFVEELVSGTADYEKQNPGKVDTHEGILKFSGGEVASPSDFAKEPNIKKMDAVGLQNFYNRSKGRSHFFKRNFAFDSLLNALDKGVKGIKTIAPVLTPIAKVGGKMLPLVGAYSSYSEAREAGLPKSAALAYTAMEETNPLPFSGIDWVKAMDSQAKEKAESMRKRYRTDEQRAEEESLENYQNSPAAKDKAYSTLRKLLNGYMLDENVPKKKIKKSYFNPETGDYEYEYD